MYKFAYGFLMDFGSWSYRCVLLKVGMYATDPLMQSSEHSSLSTALVPVCSTDKICRRHIPFHTCSNVVFLDAAVPSNYFFLHPY